jgi:hypothetical protein
MVEGGNIVNEWKLTNAELKKVANCELDTRHPGLACDRTPDGLIDCQHCPIGHYCGFIVMKGQRKLLEYLRDVALITPEAYQSPKTVIIKMLKDLETSQ